jgi:2-polyprenyl-3-methyl-5-hydroxy-6-metoxy-1,4-benzoquinol methylase
MADLQIASAHAGMRDRTYGETVNHWLLELFVPGRRVLDIGCGTGAWAPYLRRGEAIELVGIEIAPAAADVARGRYDRILTTPSEELDPAALGGTFDTIIAADVIEHLVDPFAELRRWVKWCAPNGEMVISTPNLRHFRVLRDLAGRGRFDYVDEGGMMDRTHLRWFTEASLADALEEAGWRVRRWGRLSGGRSGRVNTLARGRLNGLLAPQIQVVATPRAG